MKITKARVGQTVVLNKKTAELYPNLNLKSVYTIIDINGVNIKVCVGTWVSPEHLKRVNKPNENSTIVLKRDITNDYTTFKKGETVYIDALSDHSPSATVLIVKYGLGSYRSAPDDCKAIVPLRDLV